MRVGALVAALLLSLLAGCRTPEQNVAHNSTPAEVHYSPAENLERIDVTLLQSAHHSIDFAAYSLTDLVVANAIIEASHRGVHIRIYRDQTQFRGEDARATKASRKRRSTSDDEDDDDLAVNDLIARLSSTPNVEMRVKKSHTLMHLKSYCIDGLLVRSGSANFSPTGEKRQDNDLVILRDRDSVRNFQTNFSAIWDRADNESVTR